MNGFLLDTHIWIWSLAEPQRLVRKVRAVLDSPTSTLWLSSISVWEVIVLAQRKRLQFAAGVDTWIARARAEAPMREAPLTHEIVLATQDLDLPHRDPADRFLLATARALGLTLITADERLLASKAVPVLANR